jgi:Cu-Zn family superoxide dismutase
MKKCMLGVCATLSVLGIAVLAQAADEHKTMVGEAVAVLIPSKGSDGVGGTILFKQEKGHVHVTGEVKGLAPGKHGFHIHQFGDLRSDDGMATGGHYNPDMKAHGGPHSKERHAGDFGNIEAGADGVAKVDIKAEGLDLHHVLGRGLVVHGGADDLTTQPSGNAGPRIAVGVIGIAQVK